MKKFLNTHYEQQGIGILRIGFGLMLTIVHGWPTFKGLLEGNHSDFPDPLGIGPAMSMGLMAFAEFLCALFVFLGIYTRFALIPLIVGFSVAAFIFHAGDPFGNRELALHYLLVFVVLFITGSGRFTLHELIRVLKKA